MAEPDWASILDWGSIELVDEEKCDESRKPCLPIPCNVEHEYLSTACFHDLHEECGKLQHDRGEDGAPHCKWCEAECVCGCHDQDYEPEWVWRNG